MNNIKDISSCDYSYKYGDKSSDLESSKKAIKYHERYNYLTDKIKENEITLHRLKNLGADTGEQEAKLNAFNKELNTISQDINSLAGKSNLTPEADEAIGDLKYNFTSEFANEFDSLREDLEKTKSQLADVKKAKEKGLTPRGQNIASLERKIEQTKVELFDISIKYRKALNESNTYYERALQKLPKNDCSGKREPLLKKISETNKEMIKIGDITNKL